ncbi:MAG: hypothetical protein COV35_03655 [Alphaproteobacteria bacterium CG11_big_fil_rev_8_21_14_0_20_39_49]|nr:MAG: hypothetical protein COV35_03655 [Alphaproteobacteria bacterium CG11_big_fil_rev_8_21_14_0_20_39_49]
MANTTNLAIPLVASNQAQKEVTLNTAIATIDAILNTGVIDRGLNTPPMSPSDGDLYIVGSSPTDDWASNADDIAYYQTTWKFISPNEGMSLWVNDEDISYTWDGTAWVSSVVNALDDLSDVAITSVTENDILQYNGTNFVNQNKIDSLSQIGVNTASDNTNKLSVNSSAVLFNHNGDDSQVKINKNASGDTASHLFQNGFSGRAEFGLIGDDHYQLKVSADGSAWFQSYVVTNSSGNIDFKQDSNFSGSLTCNDNEVIRAKLKDYCETKTAPASSSGSLTLDLENGNVFEVTLTENVTTVNLNNPPASGSGGSFTLILKQDATGGRSFTFPSSVEWSNGVSPTLSTAANAVDILTFLTIDGGTIWYGFLSGVNFS